MSDDSGTIKLCCDDDCEREEVHLAHPKGKRRRPVVHHRPKGKRPLWQNDAPEALSESVQKAVGAYPMMMQWITRDVRDDYGTVTERTVYRHVRKLVQQAKIIKLDLGFAFAAYIDPKSRMLSDMSALRDYMLAHVDCLPVCTKESA